MKLNELRDAALKIAVDHGFKDASVPEDIALMHSELSEALEDYRAGAKPAEFTYDALKSVIVPDSEVRHSKPTGIPSEMADVVIRVLHFCGKHGIDLERAVTEKMRYNSLRPFKHGNKVI